MIREFFELIFLVLYGRHVRKHGSAAERARMARRNAEWAEVMEATDRIQSWMNQTIIDASKSLYQ